MTIWYVNFEMRTRSVRLDGTLSKQEMDDLVEFYIKCSLELFSDSAPDDFNVCLPFMKALSESDRAVLSNAIIQRTQIIRLNHDVNERMSYLYGGASVVDESDLNRFASGLNVDAVRRIFSDTGFLLRSLIDAKIEVHDLFFDGVRTSLSSLIISAETQVYPISSPMGVYFVVASGGPHVLPRAIYFPTLNIMLSTSHYHYFTDLIASRVVGDIIPHTLKYIDEISLYIKTKNRVPASSILLPHIGHHIWNELPIVEAFLDANTDDNRKILYIMNSANTEFFGDTLNLFLGRKFEVKYIELSDISRTVYKDGTFFVRPSSIFVTKTLSNLIISYAKRYESEFLSIIEGYLNEGRVLLLLCPRFDTRIWENFEIEMKKAIDVLLDRKIELILVVDGHNQNSRNRAKLEKIPSVYEDLERQFAERLNQIYGDRCVVISNIGQSVQRSVLAAHLSSLFITSWGAALAKYKWACRATGIICTNELHLRYKRDVVIYEDVDYVEDPVNDFYFHPQEVDTDDCVENDLAARDRANFRSRPDRLSYKILSLLTRQ